MPRRNNSGSSKRESKASGGNSRSGRRPNSTKSFSASSDGKRPGRYSPDRKNVSAGSSAREEDDARKVFKKGTRPTSSGQRQGGKRFSTTEGPSRFSRDKKPATSSAVPKRRGESFGKPYKKSYRTKSVHEGRPTGRGHARTGADAEAGHSGDGKIRLNKFIANSGVSSRREADELISMGLISVNGKVITELGHKINPGDEVRYEDKVLRAEKPVYILMNKPKGFLTTTDDPQERKTVMHLVGSAVKQRIYPVGRLDRNTTGLLLLTNDGDLADKLMHPSFNVRKVYKVELDKPLTKGDLQSIIEGVRLEEGRAGVDDVAIVSEDKKTVGIELHIGWNRVVRRIFESLGYEVRRLDRTVYAGLDKKDLPRGEWRFLRKEEIIHLKHFK